MLLPGQPWSPDGPGPTSPHDLLQLEAYLGYFEKLALILETKALDIRTLDLLLAFRFFVAMNNPHVEKLIHRDEAFFMMLIALHRRWTAHRNAASLPIPNSPHHFRTTAERGAA